MITLKMHIRAVALIRAALLFTPNNGPYSSLRSVYIEPDKNEFKARIVSADKQALYAAGVECCVYKDGRPDQSAGAPVVLSAANLKTALSSFSAAEIRAARFLNISFDPDEGADETVTCFSKNPATVTIERWGKASEPETVEKEAREKVLILMTGYPDYRAAIPAPADFAEAAPVDAVDPEALKIACKAASLLKRKNERPVIRIQSIAARRVQYMALSGDALVIAPQAAGGYTAAHNAIFRGLE